ncbi:TPA: restriction endonuclease subunit S [Enterobacter ludwigii]|jgi:type I restriction enzyme S subunit|uniref:restriction endonuclease subunit S n=1 Tax=Enterobacter sp. SORGH_AS_0287 TaxID=3041779 RepID=UPI00285824EF|nr:restriction endonuclease subunit S [Enterobacter sp. SORGH_AS_0287]ELP5688643.1 restriction endonuclease subunit S [Enterobacter ludwigii]MDR6366907.1 type I restriction enzyme S subunit [Enterobacter sp. SORGH_AS_0287]HDR2589557.1 restriction endonuclease subunit S [Enterobacter ludwigii]HDR2596321.1 restriction endonuclease subunit S [Enterobacter ludwigii]
MVPEGWKLSTFGKHVDILTGFAFKSSNYSSNPNDIRLLRGDNIEPGRLRWKNAKYWDLSEFQALDKFHLKEGDFVIAMDRTWISSGLKVAEVKASDLPCLLVQRVARIRAFPDFDQSLLKQYFSDNRFEKHVKSVQTATAVPHISPNDIRDFSFLLPPLKEQNKISKILFTWDKAIEITESLILNSLRKKKSLMQKLLTGQNRLQGFSGEWKQYHLSEISEIIISPVDKKSKAGEIPVEICNYTDVYYNDEITKSINFMKATATSKEIERYTLEIDDVIITKDSEAPGDIAVSSLVSEELNGIVCGYHLAIVRPNKSAVSGAFLNYLFAMPKIQYYFFTLATGATRFGLSIGAISKAQFSLPTIAEQKRIADLLSISDKEIKALRQKLSLLKKEKKALMQQLLTGRRRVKVDAA